MIPTRHPRKAKPQTPRPRIQEGQKILALDVSSTAAGVAMFERRADGVALLDFDIIHPKAAWNVWQRIDYIAAKLSKILLFDLAILEFTDGAKWMSKARASSWSHSVVPLAAAQTAARAAILPNVGSVELVTSSEWTGKIPKETRALLMRNRHWRYNAFASKDPGYDVADAIGIGEWRLAQ